jgi:hypothetical protein
MLQVGFGNHDARCCEKHEPESQEIISLVPVSSQKNLPVPSICNLSVDI